jgi:hypothetical protein
MDDARPNFPALRVVANVHEEWDPPLPPERLCHWEAAANLVFDDQDVRVICQYNTRELGPESLHAGLRTHHEVILQRRLYQNPFYEALFILANEPHLNSSDADDGQFRDMIAQIEASPGLLLQS